MDPKAIGRRRREDARERWARGRALRLRRSLAVGVFALAATACGSGGSGPADPGDGGPGGGGGPGDPSPLTVDCTPGVCAEIAISGDAPATLPGGALSPARGFADPSIRRDPVSGRLWMAYSWPHRAPGGGHVAVENHLAYSDDGGASWTFAGELWQADPATSSFGEGDMNSETVSLAPRTVAGRTDWYAARLTYFTDGNPRLVSFQLRVARADRPEDLAAAPQQSLAGDFATAEFAPDVNLSALSSELSGCVFSDPGLLVVQGRLFLATQCQRFGQSGEQPELEFVALFAASTGASDAQWAWSYLGRLADRADALALGGEQLLQTDLAVGSGGDLLAIFSPSEPASPLATHFGCRIVRVERLDPPRLGRRGDGTLDVRAVVTASDLDATGGPGACGYDASSATGVVLVRRVLGQGTLVTSLHATGLLP